MLKKSWVTWQIILASTWARGTSQMLPIRRAFRVWNFPLQVGAQIPKRDRSLGDVDSKVLEVASPFAFIQLIPTFLQPTANSLGASASLRKCVPPLLSVLLFKQTLYLHFGWKKLYGTYAPASCNCLLSLLNEIKRLWRHTCVGH